MKKQETAIINKAAPLISIFCYLLILSFSPDITKEVRGTIVFCLETIVPAMFTLLAFSYFILSFPLPVGMIKRTEKFLSPVFGLSGNCTQAVIIGLTGGYNISPTAAVKLLKSGHISLEQAKRLALFFSSPGFSFAVNITGISIYNSFSAGIKLFISGITADILISFIYNRIKKNNENSEPELSKSTGLSEAFTDAVDSASVTIISICARIVIFSALKSVISSVLPFSFINTFLGLFSEVSSGVKFSKEHYSVTVTAFCLYFGGFSVFIQQLSDIRKLSINPFSYLFVRIVRSFSGTAVFSLVDYLFREKVPVSAINKGVYVHSANPLASFSLLLLCAVLISVIKKDLTDADIQHKPSSIYNNRTCFTGKYVVKLTQEKLKE